MQKWHEMRLVCHTRKTGVKSHTVGSKPESEVVLATILDLESAKQCETAHK